MGDDKSVEEMGEMTADMKRWAERFITMSLVLLGFYGLLTHGVPMACLGIGVLFLIWVVTKCLTSKDFLGE